MAVLFSAREMVEAAVEKEKKRRGFYAAVSDVSHDEEMNHLFRFLSEEEEKHIVAFTEILHELPRDSHSLRYTEEMQAYMDAVIDHRLYADIDTVDFVRRAVDTKNVFHLAIGFEKDAILYFREFVPFLSAPDQGIVTGLIEQEKGHIRRLAAVKKQMGM